MNILIDDAKEKLAIFQNATGIEFRNSERADKNSVAVVVRRPSFSRNLQDAVGLMVPVVVVAGKEDEAGRMCIAEALGVGVAGAAIVVIRKGRVVTLAGRDIGPERGGVGVSAVVQAARYAFKNELVPEPLIWAEDAGEPMPEQADKEIDAKPYADNATNEPYDTNKIKVLNKRTPDTSDCLETIETVPPKPGIVTNTSSKIYLNKPYKNDATELPLSTVLGMSEHIAVVYRAGESSAATKQIAAELKGTHLELSPEPQSSGLYGACLEDAVKTGKYIYSNGSKATVSNYMGADWLVIEADIADQNIEALDIIQNRAEKVFIVAGSDIDEALQMVEMFKNNNWRLDGVLPSNHELNLLVKNTFGDLYARTAVVSI